MQEIAVVVVLCALVTVNAQMMGPYQTMGMGSVPMGWGSTHMWGSGVRQPGVMQTSQLNSMTYPTWRSHPLFRVASTPTDKNSGGLLSDLINIPKVPSSQEVLTHMALAASNVKPLYDTISDFLYEPQKARQAMIAPVYLQGMNLMRSSVPDDCGPDGMRWERALSPDWVY